MDDPNKEQLSKSSLYTVLGVEKSSSASEIRSAYRKLAMKWHPDKCSTSEQAKMKFQGIQEAYSVLSDDKKRSLYDSGLYDEGDDEGMQSFMSEIVSMMSTSSKSSFDELKDMFNQMVDSYMPEPSTSTNFQECLSSGSSHGSTSSFTSSVTSYPSEPFPYESAEAFFKRQNFTQNFCIGRQEDDLSRQRVHKKGPRRRKCPYDQGTRA